MFGFRVYNEWILTIEYRQSTKLALFFFDAKKEPKKHLGGCESPQTPERFKVVFIYLFHFSILMYSICTLLLVDSRYLLKIQKAKLAHM